MLNRLKKVDKDLIFIIIGRILQIVLMLISIRIMTTFLSPAEVGNYNLLLTILAFFNLVFLNPAGMYFSRHIIQWDSSKNLLNGLFIFILWMIVVAILSIIILTFIYHLMHYENKYIYNLFVLYIILAIVFSTTHRNVLYGLNMLGYRKQFVVFLLATLSLGIVCSFLIIYFIYSKALGWTLGIVFSEIILVYPIYKAFIRGNELNIHTIKLIMTKKKIKEILAFCIPVSITVFLMWGQNTGYKMIVDYKYSAEVLGYISVGIGVANAVFGSIESIAMQYFNPIFYKKIIDASIEERATVWNEIAQYMVPIYILSTILVISIAEYLITILVDSKFHHSYIYTRIGAGIEFFRVMTNLLNNVSQSEKNTKVTIAPYVVGFVVALGFIGFVNFGTNYFMIPVALLLAYFGVFIYMYFNMKKLLKIHYEFNSIYKSILLGMPLFTIIFIDCKIDIANSLCIVFMSGIYFIFSGGLLMRKKVV